jgi:serine/threonine protein kinase
MEWLDGRTLFERLLEGPLTPNDSVSLCLRVAEAIAVLHRCAIIHRDIKPANLFLAGENPGDVKVLDFGIARSAIDALNVHATFGGGTWAYMSPEQAMGAAELGPRVDVFSLGCVLYECLSGKPAYPPDRAGAMLAKVYGQPPQVRDLVPDVPPAIDRLVSQMLTHDPAARLPHAGAVAAELSRI